MMDSNQEGYRTLGWIINKSEQGLFLVIAEEEIQREIVEIYRQGTVEIYDYRRHPGAYAVRQLQEWVARFPETRVFLVANFHLALQDGESIKRLNFSRDMLEALGRNLIFLVTPYADNQLARGAYDFYSFLKLRITFHGYQQETERQLPVTEDIPTEESGWGAEDARQKMAEAYALMEQAKDERAKAQYEESEKLLLQAREIKQNLLGEEHLELAQIDYELADVYERRGKYRQAEELDKKSLRIRERELGEEHPDTLASYNNLAGVYERQEKYLEAEELYEKALKISKEVLGEEHPSIATSYNNLAGVYVEQGRYEEAEQLYEKALGIYKEILGEGHPSTATIYNNLAFVYEKQRKYEEAEELFGKALRIWKEVLGEEHPDTQAVYKNLELLYSERDLNGDFDQWLAEKMKD